ncbi:Glycosyltransferase [Congregibacter litoralis KT71]|uniref:Glycosyltransferase n=2 Tax=Congregibacter TaxID=393661 RepID=A4A6D0_9GAMM|nr:Glycosyltransferase [Congregibacter litoralis KT71]
MIATSYPRSDIDWQGLFIKSMVDAAAAHPQLQIRLWSPKGPLHERAEYTASEPDVRFLRKMSDKGGVAHLLRNKPVDGALTSLELLARLRHQYRRSNADILHINWLQNAIPLIGMNRKAVITVLGTDYHLLGVPGMRFLLRAALKTNRCVLAPNASWMEPRLKDFFGDVAEIRTTNFGIDAKWFDLGNGPDSDRELYLCVSRVTKNKMGPLFQWSKELFSRSNPLHLVGPNQEQLSIPEWVEHHGPLTGEVLAESWFPKTKALISLSEHAEGRPQVMLEAMAAGIPIIGSSLPAHRCTIDHRKTGFLVDTEAAYVEAVKNLDKAKIRKFMSKNASAVARDSYGSWNDCAGRFRAIYGSLL